MKHDSVSPMSRNLETLLSAERELMPQSELVRRRALARARMALLPARNQPQRAAGLFVLARRFRLVAAAALLASTGVAAWFTLAPWAAPATSHATTGGQTPKQTAAPAALSQHRPATPTLPPPAQSSTEASSLSALAKRSVESRAPAANRQKRSKSSEELILLDQARRAVVSDRFQTALKVLQRHTVSFPKSQLREEREALRVRALKGAGLAEQAGKAASDFESRYPNSVLTPQMNPSGRTPR
jgi:hypothetical protein